MFGLAILVIVIFSLPLIKMIVKITNQEASKAVENTAKGLSNASSALPTLGAGFATSAIADSLNEVPPLKAAVGCTDDSIKTMPQLHKWMQDNGMM